MAMFDEQPKNNSQAPNNLPTASSGPAPAQSKPAAAEPVDILDEVDKAPENNVNVKSPATSPSSGGGAVPPAMSSPQKSSSKEPILAQGRKVVLGLVVVVVILVLGGAGWYAYTLVNNGAPAQTPDQVADDTAQQPATNQAAVNSAPQEPVQPQEPAVRDTDRDGLNDDEEGLYGTNINKIDTDNDGLTDRDEVRAYETDPNNPDTDGDGFSDGEEVFNRYNPKGSGPLLDFEESFLN